MSYEFVPTSIFPSLHPETLALISLFHDENRLSSMIRSDQVTHADLTSAIECAKEIAQMGFSTSLVSTDDLIDIKQIYRDFLIDPTLQFEPQETYTPYQAQVTVGIAYLRSLPDDGTQTITESDLTTIRNYREIDQVTHDLAKNGNRITQQDMKLYFNAVDGLGKYGLKSNFVDPHATEAVFIRQGQTSISQLQEKLIALRATLITRATNGVLVLHDLETYLALVETIYYRTARPDLPPEILVWPNWPSRN